MPPLSMNIEGVPRYSLVSFILNIYLCETAPSVMDGAVILFLCYATMTFMLKMRKWKGDIVTCRYRVDP